MSERAILTYASPSSSRWRRYVKSATLGIIVLVSLWCGSRLYPWLKQRSRLMQIQANCVAFQVPSDTIVYEEENFPEPFPPFEQLTAYENEPRDAAYTGPGPRFVYQGRVAAAAVQLRAQTMPGGSEVASLFLGQRTTRRGETRLISAFLERPPIWNKGTFATPIVVDVLVVEPYGWFDRGQPRATTAQLVIGSWPALPRNGQQVRFYAGQPDPADASRFSIAYQIGDTPGIIDGVLNSDLTVTLHLAYRPLATP